MINAMISKVTAWFKGKNEATAKDPGAQPVPTWTLLLGNANMGEFTFAGYETPWISADFNPTADFQRFKPFFAWQRENDLHLDEDAWEGERSPEFDSLIDVVNDNGGFQLLDNQTNELRSTILHFGDDYSCGTFR